MKQKKAVTKEPAGRYKRATKGRKSQVLDEYVAITGYNRSYAAWAIRQAHKSRIDGRKKKAKRPRIREKKYADAEFKAIRKIWATLGMPAGKRPAPYMEEIVAVMERFGELELSRSVRDNLLSVLSVHHRPDDEAGAQTDYAQGA